MQSPGGRLLDFAPGWCLRWGDFLVAGALGLAFRDRQEEKRLCSQAPGTLLGSWPPRAGGAAVGGEAGTAPSSRAALRPAGTHWVLLGAPSLSPSEQAEQHGVAEPPERDGGDTDCGRRPSRTHRPAPGRGSRTGLGGISSRLPPPPGAGNLLERPEGEQWQASLEAGGLRAFPTASLRAGCPGPVAVHGACVAAACCRCPPGHPYLCLPGLCFHLSGGRAVPGSGLGRKAARTVSCQAWSEGPGHGASLPREASWDTEPPWQEGEGASLVWWSCSRRTRPHTHSARGTPPLPRGHRRSGEPLPGAGPHPCPSDSLQGLRPLPRLFGSLRSSQNLGPCFTAGDTEAWRPAADSVGVGLQG